MIIVLLEMERLYETLLGYKTRRSFDETFGENFTIFIT